MYNLRTMTSPSIARRSSHGSSAGRSPSVQPVYAAARDAAAVKGIDPSVVKLTGDEHGRWFIAAQGYGDMRLTSLGGDAWVVEQGYPRPYRTERVGTPIAMLAAARMFDGHERGRAFGYASGSVAPWMYHSQDVRFLERIAAELDKRGVRARVVIVRNPVVDGPSYVVSNADKRVFSEAVRVARSSGDGRATGSIDGKIGLRFHGRWSDDDGKKPMHLTEPLSMYPDKFKAKISTDVEAEEAYEAIDAEPGSYEVLGETGSASGRTRRRKPKKKTRAAKKKSSCGCGG